MFLRSKRVYILGASVYKCSVYVCVLMRIHVCIHKFRCEFVCVCVLNESMCLHACLLSVYVWFDFRTDQMLFEEFIHSSIKYTRN